MAEAEKAQANNFTSDLSKMLAGQAVPVTTIDFKRKDAMQFKPKLKENTCYIVMTVLFNDLNQVLMVQEAKESCRGTWYLPAGRLESNETLMDGAKREIKEEAGLKCVIDSLIHIHFRSCCWIRLAFIGTVTGGKLKSTDEADEESLQAAFFDINAVFSQEINLRSPDVIPVIQQAWTYKESLTSTPVHPPLKPALVCHSMLCHRFLLVADLAEKGLSILISSKESPLHIVTAAIAPRDPTLFHSVLAFIKKVISSDQELLPTIHGILGVEHDGNKDGMCITTMVSLAVPSGEGLPAVQNESFRWQAITEPSLVDSLHKGLDNHLVKLIEKSH